MAAGKLCFFCPGFVLHSHCACAVYRLLPVQVAGSPLDVPETIDDLWCRTGAPPISADDADIDDLPLPVGYVHVLTRLIWVTDTAAAAIERVQDGCFVKRCWQIKPLAGCYIVGREAVSESDALIRF